MGRMISLEVAPSVFTPTLTTNFLTDQVHVGELADLDVLDMGCGAGPIAIACALAGAKSVTAIDVMPEACALARRNAALNGVASRVHVLQGDLFAPIQGKRFDLIIDDVSGVAEEIARLSSWFPKEVPSGGNDGSFHTINMLTVVLDYLTEEGTLLFPVLSLSRASAIVDAARRVFGARVARVASKRIPFNQELRGHERALLRLRDQGIVSFERIRSRYFWTLDIYRARSGGSERKHRIE
jgi:precorrin-6B methylase 2